jgi:hypothetical protein
MLVLQSQSVGDTMSLLELYEVCASVNNNMA